MSTPTVKVEVAFGAQPFADPAGFTWVDITSRTLDDIKIRRGRASELDTFSAGSCTLTLDNHDRAFDPEHTTGPYYGSLVPNVPLRVTLTISAVSHVRFYGYVDGWPQSYAPPADAVCNITATDLFKLLSRTPLPASPWAAGLENFNPKVWLRLGESGGGVAHNSGSGPDGTYTAPLATGQPLVAGDSQPSTVVDYSGVPQVTITDTAGIASSADLFLSVLVAFDEPTDPGLAPELVVQLGSSNYELHLSSSGPVVESDAGSNHAAFISSLQMSSLSGLIWVVYGRYSSTGYEAFFVNGRHHPTPTTGAPAFPSGPAQLSIAGFPQWVGYGVIGPVTFRLGDVLIGDYSATPTNNPILNDTALASMWQLLVAPWAGDDTGTRTTNTLALIGLASALQAVEVGTVLLDYVSFGQNNVLSYLQALEATEQGRLFVTGDGRLQFHSHDYEYTNTSATTSQATFTDDGTGIASEPNLNVTTDERFVINQVTVSRNGGQPQTVQDSASVLANGAINRSISTLHRSDVEARNLAESILYRYKTPRPRLAGWTSKPLTSTTTWQTLLALELAYRVTHAMKPQNTGARVSRDLLIESIEETYGPGSMGDASFTFAGSPVDSGSYFKWGTSNWGSTDVWR